MYVDPFAMGVFTTILVELVAAFGIAIWFANKNK